MKPDITEEFSGVDKTLLEAQSSFLNRMLFIQQKRKVDTRAEPFDTWEGEIQNKY